MLLNFRKEKVLNNLYLSDVFCFTEKKIPALYREENLNESACWKNLDSVVASCRFVFVHDGVDFNNKTKHQKSRSNRESQWTKTIFGCFHRHDDEAGNKQCNACEHDDEIVAGKNHVPVIMLQSKGHLRDLRQNLNKFPRDFVLIRSCAVSNCRPYLSFKHAAGD